jgi:hypothetical protein
VSAEITIGQHGAVVDTGSGSSSSVSAFRDAWRAELAAQAASPTPYAVHIERGAAAAAKGRIPYRLAADGSAAPPPPAASEAALPARGFYGTRLLRYADRSVFYPAELLSAQLGMDEAARRKEGGPEATPASAAAAQRDNGADGHVTGENAPPTTVSSCTQGLRLLQLPMEILRNILTRVSAVDLAACAATCRTLRSAIAAVTQPWQNLRFGVLERRATDSFVRRTLLEQRRRGVPLRRLFFYDCEDVSQDTFSFAAEQASTLTDLYIESCEVCTVTSG